MTLADPLAGRFADAARVATTPRECLTALNGGEPRKRGG
jgi:hypothetical protein